MKWPSWSISAGSGDFLPLVIGVLLLLMTIPPFIMLLWQPDRNSGVIGVPLLIILGIGAMIGVAFTIVGIRQCAYPGWPLYQLSHFRFSRKYLGRTGGR